MQFLNKKHFVHLGTLWIILLIINACAPAKKLDQVIAEATQELETKLNNCKNNQERLYTLLQGDFMAYSNRDSILKVWRSNTGGDSLLVPVQPIGEPSKHGYLLLCGYYLTQLPNHPYFSYVLRVEQISRDTLEVWKHDIQLYTLKEMLDKKIEKDYDLKVYIDTSRSEHYGTYAKKSNTEFTFSVPRSKYLFQGKGPDRYFRERSGFLNLSQEVTIHSYYNKEGEHTSDSYSYFMRRHDFDLKKWGLAVKEE